MPPSQQVSQRQGAGLDACAAADLLRNVFRDPSEPYLAAGVVGPQGHHLAPGRVGALGDNAYRKLPPGRIPTLHLGAHFVQVVRYLGYQDHVRGRSDAGV